MKRILCIIDSLGAGGAQRQLVGLASMLKNKGLKVKVITYYNIPFYKNVLDENNVDYTFVEKAQKSLTRIYYIHKEISKYNPDWIISFLDTPSIISCIDKLFWHKKYKLLVSERNTTQTMTLRERIKFCLYKCADIIVPNAYSQGAFIKNKYPQLKLKVNVIHNFVDLEYFSCKKKFQRKQVPVIVTVASIWEPKNTLGFIDAVKILNDKGCKCEFHWYGKVDFAKDYLIKCESKIKDYGLKNYLYLHNKTKNIKDVYQNADYFCLPSFYEGTPNVICEAMACGLPVICSNVCDNARYVKSNQNGYLFNPQNIEDIAHNIYNILLLSDEQYENMCQKSRSLAEQYLSEQCFIEKYLDILK